MGFLGVPWGSLGILGVPWDSLGIFGLPWNSLRFLFAAAAMGLKLFGNVFRIVGVPGPMVLNQNQNIRYQKNSGHATNNRSANISGASKVSCSTLMQVYNV